tara:strand:- start:58 stop:675 length:618 start_codon:yes stop_codon:yes gene_type:complete
MSKINVNKIVSPDFSSGDGSIDIASNGNTTVDTDTFFADAANDRFGVNVTPERSFHVGASNNRGIIFDAGVLREPIEIVSNNINAGVNIDVNTSPSYYYTTAPSASWTPNVRWSSSVTLNSVLATGDRIFVTTIMPLSSSSYYASSLNIDGTSSGIDLNWVEDETPTQAGNYEDAQSSGWQFYTYLIIKTGSATYNVSASQGWYA